MIAMKKQHTTWMLFGNDEKSERKSEIEPSWHQFVYIIQEVHILSLLFYGFRLVLEFILLQNFIHTHTHTHKCQDRGREWGHNQTNGTLPLAVSRRFIPTACGIVFICESYIHFYDTYLPVSSSNDVRVTLATYTHTNNFEKQQSQKAIRIF